MTNILEMPRVAECTVVSCAYNHEGCHAFAITIGADTAMCATFVELPAKGGVGSLAMVGACQQATCRHNTGLECQASTIQVGATTAECQTFEPRPA